MGRLIALLVVCGAAFAASRNEDLKVIVEKTFLEPQCESLLNMVALEAIQGIFKELAANFTTEAKEFLANAEILEVTQENFDEIANATKPVILDINASWCNSCKMMEPILEELSEKYKDTIQFAKIDFDSQAELVKKYEVASLPTILFIKPGQIAPAMKNVGFMSKKDFETKISEFLKK